MRIERLRDWAPAPGRLVVFRPTSASLAAAQAAPVSPGEPSFLQQDHLNAYRGTVAAGGTHRAWTGTATHLSGAFDAGAMAGALARFVVRHEGLRTWFDLSGAAAVRHLVGSDDVAFEAQELEAPDDWDAAWESFFVALADEACRPDSWPPFVLAAVVREDDASLFWACDHAFTDGASQLMVATELATAYAAEAGRPAVELPAVGSFVAYAAQERERAAGYGLESPELQGWLEIMTRHEGRLPRFPLDLGLAPGETAPVALRDFDALSGDQLEVFDRRCREAGGRFTSGLFAALAVTERRLTGADRYFGVTVLGTRAGDYAMSHGWFCNFAPVEFAIPDGGFAEVVAAAEEAYAVTRSLAAMPVHVAIGALLMSGLTTPEQLGSPQLVSYLDLRKFPGAGLEAHDRGIHFTGVGRTANASMWINREDRRLQIGAQTPDTAAAQQAVDAFFAALAETFADAVSEVATGAGHHR
ncbi:condensation domain-containing protein [Nocardioides sp. DS6]|uniref:Condensation domain-containing protein n=1 Tax=Nocardioides eburneus TaxID=3231482 RepID=A0ABV3SXP5_9ACTN